MGRDKKGLRGQATVLSHLKKSDKGRDGAEEATARVRETLKRPPIRLTPDELRKAEGDSV